MIPGRKGGAKRLRAALKRSTRSDETGAPRSADGGKQSFALLVSKCVAVALGWNCDRNLGLARTPANAHSPHRGSRPADRCCYLPREVFFGRLGLVGVFFSVWACDFGRFFPATSGSFPVPPWRTLARSTRTGPRSVAVPRKSVTVARRAHRAR